VSVPFFENKNKIKLQKRNETIVFVVDAASSSQCDRETFGKDEWLRGIGLVSRQLFNNHARANGTPVHARMRQTHCSHGQR
jgi:hypothetical protein